jgi:2-polyprenyl-3-methyl-5-hydroxy-6-metoxy-1,4-benzoquinol methylase
MSAICPNCGASNVQPFYSVAGVPTNSCLLISDRTRALYFPRGEIELTFCCRCSFIFNSAFQPDRTVYSELYEETQGYSATFNSFHRQLAEELIERHGIRGKNVIEIGCGKGEFLTLLCELGENRGIGFDPSFIPERLKASKANIRFVREFFSDNADIPDPDFICCKMTLEHIPQTRDFIRAVRRIAAPERNTIVFFQIPDARRILDEAAFWDVYYEHCNYFTRTSLAHLFSNNGFEVIGLTTTYAGQYLTIEARPVERFSVALSEDERRERDALPARVADFARRTEAAIDVWNKYLHKSSTIGQCRTVLWGSGSKAVAFLTSLGIRDEIEYVVDINPHRHGQFIPGTGQRIVGPAFLSEYRPDTVIAMNPIYLQEIAQEMGRHGSQAQLISVDHLPASEKVLG